MFLRLITILPVLLSSTLFAQELLHQQEVPSPSLSFSVYNEGTPRGPDGRDLYPGLFGHSAPIREVYSADSRLFAGVQEGSLYVRNRKRDEITLLSPPEPGWQWDVEAAKWNEDGSKLLVRQIDVRHLGTITLTDEEGNTRERTYSFMGQPLEKHQYYIVDVATKNKIKVPHGDEMPFVHAMAWHRGRAYLLRADRMMHRLELLEVDSGGEMRIVITEKSDSYIIGLNLGQHYDMSLDNSNVVRFYEDMIIWTSEKSGTRQLYLYSLDGRIIRQLTHRETNGIVVKPWMLHKGWVYFDGFEINVGNNESLVQGKFCRASLATGEIQVLSDGAPVLANYWSPNKKRCLVYTGDLDHMQIDEYNEQGEWIKTHWETGLPDHDKFGYHPEYAWTETEDGTATIGSAILKPADFDPASSYPVVEYIYGPPFYSVMPESPYDRRSKSFQDLANQGFIVVFTDARGTEGRGREYQEYSYGRLGQVEIADHAYVLEQLARDRPYMDMSRVGIIGHSMGGYFALRAMVLRPDLYRVGHINAPNVDPDRFRVPLEPYFGCLPKDCPDTYAAASVTGRLDQLQGRILLTFGTADQHIPVSEVYRLTDAMDKAGYDQYELDIYKGMHHQVMQDPKWYPRMVEFFKTELMNAN